MSFIGNPLVSQAFVTDSFSGNGSTTAFTMSVAPATTAAVLVAISGVVQDPSTYSIVGTTLTFSQAPPSATANISTRYLGIPSTGVTSTAYRTVTEFTATAAQTTFTPPSFTPGFVNVYRNGVLLGSADYVASSGTTVVLNSAATLGDLVTVESFLVSSILNAVAQTNGSSVNQVLTTPTITTPTITTPTISSPIISGNMGIGTSSPASPLHVAVTRTSSTNATIMTLSDNVTGIQTNGVYKAIRSTSNGGPSVSEIRFLETDGTNNNTSIAFATQSTAGALTERMRITQNGYVTRPYQPAFCAYYTSNISAVSGVQLVPLNATTFDTTGSFNTGTGRYTIPQTGYYLFSVGISMEANSTNQTYISAEVRVNGSRTNMYFGWAQKYNPGNTYANSTGTYIVYLNVGDYVEIGTEIPNATTIFGGVNGTKLYGYLLG